MLLFFINWQKIRFIYLYVCVRVFALNLFFGNSLDSKHIGTVFRLCVRYGYVREFNIPAEKKKVKGDKGHSSNSQIVFNVRLASESERYGKENAKASHQKSTS